MCGAKATAPGDMHECEKAHASEAQSMEDLGRLLAEVKSYARYGPVLYALSYNMQGGCWQWCLSWGGAGQETLTARTVEPLHSTY